MRDLTHTSQAMGGPRVYQAILPGAYAGVYVNIAQMTPESALRDLRNPLLSPDDQRRLIPRGRAKLVAVEAALGLDWYRIIADGLVVGIDRFGASAPDKALAEAYDLTPQKIAARISKWLGEGAKRG